MGPGEERCQFYFKRKKGEKNRRPRFGAGFKKKVPPNAQLDQVQLTHRSVARMRRDL